MPRLREWFIRLWQTLRPGRDDRDLEDELRLHHELAAEAVRREGEPPETAMRAARIQEGALAPAIEAVRDQRGLPWLEDLGRDLRIGVRGLARRPGFTAIAALTLSIGTGATAAMFSVTNAFLFRPFPAPDPEQLVVVAQLDEHSTNPHRLSYPEYLDYRDRNDVFQGLAAHDLSRALLSADGASGPVFVEYVSPDFFEMLQVDAGLGRTFLPLEGRQPGDAPVVVLSYRSWQNRFGADPAVVGRSVRLGTAELTVIGVAPESFVFTDYSIAPELYVPTTQSGLVSQDTGDGLADRNQEQFQLLGRLRSGLTVQDARVNLSVLTTALAAEYPESMEQSELWVEQERRARPFPESARFVVPLLTVVMVLAGLVLLIACANVTTLLIGRGIDRQREMALRAGLGATALRLLRQLLSESLLLALLGGVGGALAALWITDLISTLEFVAGFSGVTLDVTMDWRVFAFTAVAATLTGLIAGLVPALRATRVDLTRAIGSGGRGSSRDASGQRVTSGLVVAQVAMSLLLLVCAGLFVRGAQNMVNLDLGFRTDELLLVSADPLAQGYEPDRADAFYRDVATEVAALPGVRSASWASAALRATAGQRIIRAATLDGGAIEETEPATVFTNDVDPAFFDTVALRVLQGRAFRTEDASAGRDVALISETTARRFWPGQDPLGRRFVAADEPDRPFQVIGIVGDAHFSGTTAEVPLFALFPFGRELSGPATLHIHTVGPPTALAPAVTDVVRRRDPTLAIYGVVSMTNHVYDSPLLVLSRLGAQMVGALGTLGLLLAAVGLYGVVAHSVSQRMREFGIRAALGATAADIIRLAVGKGVTLTAIGLVLGILGAAGMTPFVTGFLIDVDPTDPVVFAVTGLLLSSVALLACFVPSLRAAAVDPVATLNAE